jgi:hypothetical protein
MDILYISGGLLEIPKCSFYVVSWKFDIHGSASLDTWHDKLRPIDITNRWTGDTKNITQISPATSVKTLGYWVQAEGLSAVQFVKLSEKNRKLIQAFGSLASNWFQMDLAFHKVLLASMSYVFSISPWSQKNSKLSKSWAKNSSYLVWDGQIQPQEQLFMGPQGGQESVPLYCRTINLFNRLMCSLKHWDKAFLQPINYL